jgi:hypothetical protein
MWEVDVVEFSSAKRLSFLVRHIQPGSRATLVEIGSNGTESFQRALRDLGEYRRIELNTSVSGDLDSLSSVSANSVDILAAYFVLEHVARPRQFLADCHLALKPGGLLVVEVPNLYIYPINANGIVHFEHVSHFSPRTLSALAADLKLQLLEISYKDCSRPAGFAAVFTKSDRSQPAIQLDASERHLAVACMREGAIAVKAYHEQLASARSRIEEAGRCGLPIIIWAANQCCFDLLGDLEIPTTALIVDSNPAKADYLSPCPVHLPWNVADAIRLARLFVINTPLHAKDILHYIQTTFGRTVGDGEVIILNPGYETAIFRADPGRSALSERSDR